MLFRRLVALSAFSCLFYLFASLRVGQKPRRNDAGAWARTDAAWTGLCRRPDRDCVSARDWAAPSAWVRGAAALVRTPGREWGSGLFDAEHAAVVVAVLDALPHGGPSASRFEAPRKAQRHGVVLAPQVVVRVVAYHAFGNGAVRVSVLHEGEEALKRNAQGAVRISQTDVGGLLDAALVEPRKIGAPSFW